MKAVIELKKKLDMSGVFFWVKIMSGIAREGVKFTHLLICNMLPFGHIFFVANKYITRSTLSFIIKKCGLSTFP